MNIFISLTPDFLKRKVTAGEMKKILDSSERSEPSRTSTGTESSSLLKINLN